MAETIEIGNVRDYWDGEKMQLPEHAVYVGRRNNRRGMKASPLANRHVVGRPRCLRIAGDGSMPTAVCRTREEAIENFALDMMAFKWQGKNAELARLRALHEKHGKLLLLCWCHPKPCHAGVIKEVLEAGGERRCVKFFEGMGFRAYRVSSLETDANSPVDYDVSVETKDNSWGWKVQVKEVVQNCPALPKLMENAHIGFVHYTNGRTFLVVDADDFKELAAMAAGGVRWRSD